MHDVASKCESNRSINRAGQSTHRSNRIVSGSISLRTTRPPPQKLNSSIQTARRTATPAARSARHIIHSMTLALKQGLRFATTTVLASIAAGLSPLASAAYVSSSSSCSNGSNSGRTRGLSTTMSATSHRVSRNDNYGGKGVTMTPIAGPPSSTIIWLHGLGDSGEGWAGAFDPRAFPATKMIFPTAPTRPISLNGGMAMPGWFDIRGLEESSPEDHAGFAEANERIERIIQGEVAAGIPAEKIVLGGFSQGGAVTLHVTLRATTKLAGAVVLSGWLPLKAEYPGALSEAGKNMAYFHGHGDADGIVRYTWGKHSAERLKEMGVANYRFETYRGLDHGATPEELAAVVEFVKGLLQ